MQFEYIKQTQSQHFSYVRLPKILFTAQFKELSTDAKLLYSLMLDRVSLSQKHNWFDNKGNTYIIYTIAQIQEDLCIGNVKAVKLLDDLQKIGLIEKVRRGLNKPNLIYPKNVFMEIDVPGEAKRTSANGEIPRENDGASAHGDSPRDDDNTLTEMQNCNFRECQNKTSGDVDSTDQEVLPKNTTKTDSTEPEWSKTELTNTDFDSSSSEGEEAFSKKIDEFFAGRINQAEIRRRYPHMLDTIDAILDCLYTAITSTKKSFRVGGEERSADDVRSRLLVVDAEDIELMLDKIARSTNAVHNARAYYLTMLYNAHQDTDAFYNTVYNRNNP